MLSGNPDIDLVICVLGYAWAFWSEGLGHSKKFAPNYVLQFLKQFVVGGWNAVKAQLPKPVVGAVEALAAQAEGAQAREIAALVQEHDRAIDADQGTPPGAPDGQIRS
jgi:hypothetical protein